MLNHWYIDNFIFKMINMYAGYLFTGLFFTLSGYGIVLSLRKNDKDIKYLLKKIINIYLSYLFFYIINIILMVIFSKYKFDIKNIIFDLVQIKLPLCSTWFLKVLIGCYILNYFTYKITRNKTHYILIIATIIYTILCLYFKIESKWYLTVYCYIIGVIIADKKQFIINKIYCTKLLNKIILIISVLLCLLISLIFNEFTIGKIVFICMFSILFIAFTLLFDINSKVLNFIGKYTLDIYLSHLCLIYIFDNIIDNYIIKEIVFLLLVVITVILKNKLFGLKDITKERKNNV